MYFLKLLRPINLIIIAVTMYATAWYFDGLYSEGKIWNESFTWLVISAVLIAGAGNIINDYFDVRTDRINKPDRLIIGKYVNRRAAILAHWTLNFAGLGIAIYISWRQETLIYVLIHLITINILWFYSLSLKRRFLSGNILIAGLTALVPVLVGIYYWRMDIVTNVEPTSPALYPFREDIGHNFVIYISIGLGLYAFILNLAREIVKDMEDVEGDISIRARTVPIILGYQKAKWITAFVLSGTIISTLMAAMIFHHVELIAVSPIIFSAIIVIVCFILLVKASTKKQYRLINHLIKLSMISGLLSPVFWKLLIIYGAA